MRRDIPNVGFHCNCSLEMHKANIEIAEKHHRAAEEAQWKQSQFSLISGADPTAIRTDDMDGDNTRVSDASIVRTVQRGSVRYTAGTVKRFRASTRKHQRNRLPDFEFYSMNKRHLGFHLILAQENFDKAAGLGNPDNPGDDGKREGTAVDVKALEKAYKHLGFQNITFWDKTVAEVKQILAQFSKMDHSANDCIAVTVLTHGTMDELFAKDGSFPADELWQPFQANSCPSLAGRPKLFICQACQGTKKNPGAETRGLQSDGSNVRIATQSDFIWGFSTCRGEVSYRHCQKGSIYIQALCKVILEDKNRSMDFASLLEKANYETASEFNKPGYEPYMQCPNFTNTLRGKVKFPKKKDLVPVPSALHGDTTDADLAQELSGMNLTSSTDPQEQGQQNTWV